MTSTREKKHKKHFNEQTRKLYMLHVWMITAESDTKVAVCNVDRHGRQRFEGSTWNRQAGCVTVKLSVACTYSNLTIISVNLSKTEQMN